MPVAMLLLRLITLMCGPGGGAGVMVDANEAWKPPRTNIPYIPVSLRGATANEEDISYSLVGKFQEKIHYPPSPKGLPFGAVHDLNGISADLDELLFPFF